MNEREKFLESMQSFVARYVERTQTMSEPQVVKALRALEATRNSERETWAFLNSVSLRPSDEPEDEITKLRSQLSSRARPAVSPFYLSDDFEDALKDALKKRLKMLRKNNK